MEMQAIASGANGGRLVVTSNGPIPAGPAGRAALAAAAYTAMSATVGKVREVERHQLQDISDRAGQLRAASVRSLTVNSIAIVAILLLVLLVTVVVGQSMVKSLRRLRMAALDVAGVRLPTMVQRIAEGGVEDTLDVQPIAFDSTDEVGEVARAFDQVHSEAVRLAGNEALLRGNVNAMFVNLSRRSQSLVERQLRLIDTLEHGEEDAERLSSLFQLDHLATRMRRNSENLLVLAGHEPPRRRAEAVALVDVLRAAVSEIEQYDRISLNVQPGIAVRGEAVNDMVHLTAELLENATSFSASGAPVTVSGYLLASGGALIDITDAGVGMDANEMAHANWRLDNPPVVDVAVSRRMGLFVVARLAARHGTRVRLRPVPNGGLTALVWLPSEVISLVDPAAVAGQVHIGPFTPGDPSMGTGFPRGETVAGSGTEVKVIRPERLRRPAPSFGDAGAAATVFPAPTAFGGGSGSSGSSGSSLLDPPSTADSPGLGVAGAGSPSATGPLASLGSVGSAFEPAAAKSAADTGSAQPNEVVVPPVTAAEESRLPIFESVESDWFRGSRRADPGISPRDTTSRWTTSGADDGWRAAAVARAPVAAGLTKSGLPRRQPRANLIPGTAPAKPEGRPVSAPSAGATRDRFARYQQGVRDARAAAREAGDGPSPAATQAQAQPEGQEIGAPKEDGGKLSGKQRLRHPGRS
jgi:signal transduction histidine kinase